jgi:NADH-quinone oxidoreductase subunit L
VTTTLLLTLLFPLLGFLYCALIGWRAADKRASGLVASLAVSASFVCALLVFAGLQELPEDGRFPDLVLSPWINAGRFSAPLGFLVDPLSAVMLLIVTGVGALIHWYATGYMRDHAGHLDPGYNRFFAFMNLFVLAMLVLVLADNFVLLMVGWGGVGVCSYFLIAFWFENPANASAGTKAFVTNAVGDVGLLLAAFMLFWTFGRVDYDGVFRAVQGGQGGGAVPWIAFLLLVGAAAKSAQIPLHVWLPDAMAGPTPVSALIHAATMVTAGVYLIARAHPLYEHAPVVMALVAAIGTVTALFAATVALVQHNLKRVIAYSTLSQLGYMFAGVGVGAYGPGMFHLTTHAFFKALLFLAAGIVIHELAGEEDMRLMGGLRRRLPLVWFCFLIGAAANAGVPPLSGFFSKDEIVAAAFGAPGGNVLLGALLLLTSGLTGVYMFRALFLTFHGEPAPEQARLLDPHGSHPSGAMVVPVVILAFFAFVAGGAYALFEGWLHPALTHWGGQPAEAGSPLSPLALLTTLVGLVGISIAWLFYVRDRSLPRRLSRAVPGVEEMLRSGYYVDAFYSQLLVIPGRVGALVLAGPIDNWVIDGLLVRSVTAVVRWASLGLRDVQTGFVRNYALAILAGVIVILGYMTRFGG